MTFTSMIAGAIVCLCNHQVNMHLRTSCSQQQQQQHFVPRTGLQQSVTNTKQLFVPGSTGPLWSGVSSKKSPVKKNFQTPYEKSASATVTSTPLVKVPEASETDSSSSSTSCLKLAGITVLVQSPNAAVDRKLPGDIIKLPSKVSTNLSVYGKSTVDVFGHGIIYFMSQLLFQTTLIN